METLAHLLLLATFVAVIRRHRKAAVALFFCSLVFSLWVFSLHATDKLNLNF